MLPRIKDERTESALCVGVITALLWGLGISVRGFLGDPLAITWMQWFLQLVGGILACLTLPWLLLRATDWISIRVEVWQRAGATHRKLDGLTPAP